jgi:DNA-binding NarL/FixJ family response regulator
MPSVVLADDEEFVRYFMRQVMESLYYEVIAEVQDGNELVNVMKENPPDILVLDINMPNMTGLEFLQQYARFFEDTCIIILTSAVASDIMDKISQTKIKFYLLRKDTPPEQMGDWIQDFWTSFKKGKA